MIHDSEAKGISVILIFTSFSSYLTKPLFVVHHHSTKTQTETKSLRFTVNSYILLRPVCSKKCRNSKAGKEKIYIYPDDLFGGEAMKQRMK